MKNWKHNETLINHFLCCLFFLPSPPSCISLSQTHNFVQYHFDQFHTANSRVRLAPTTCERIWKKVCRHLLLMLLLFFMDDVWYFVSIFNGTNEIFNLVWLFQNYLRDTAWIRSPVSPFRFDFVQPKNVLLSLLSKCQTENENVKFNESWTRFRLRI